MSNHRRRSSQRKQFSRPIHPAARSAILIPTDLCSPSLIQRSYAGFTRSTVLFGAPLLSQSEPYTTAASFAVDSLVHLTEGWRFLSAALASVLTNATSQAVHFAYYAELRATVSILSAHGMRVSNGNNIYLEHTGVSKAPSWKAEPTHKVVWKLWAAWAATPDAEALFLDQLRVLPSVTIGNLKSSVSKVAANPTLTRWALDLSLGNEHLARNKASYETAAARHPLLPMQGTDFEFVRDLWTLAEPTGYGLRFEQELAMYLINAELSDEGRASDPGARHAWLQHLIDDVERTTGTPRDTLESFFNSGAPSSPIFGFAFASDVKPANMIARAFFLLRMATLMPNGAMASHPGTPAKEWLKDWLEQAGLFERNAGTPPEDVWQDFEHLSRLQPPPGPLPAQLHSKSVVSIDTHLLSRADALLAWSTSL